MGRGVGQLEDFSLVLAELSQRGQPADSDIQVSLFGGTTATVMSALVSGTGDLNWPAYYLMIAGVIGGICVFFMRETARKPLPGSVARED